jgi:predicted kinase
MGKQEIYSGTEKGKTLYIMRGPPGSGKSTYAKELSEHVFSADDFFKAGETYQFDASLLEEAHRQNQVKVQAALDCGLPSVVVDNTSTCAWEMRPYVVLAMHYGYNIALVEMSAPGSFDAEKLAKLNQHGVNQEKIAKMIGKFERNMTLDKILSSQRPIR